MSAPGARYPTLAAVALAVAASAGGAQSSARPADSAVTVVALSAGSVALDSTRPATTRADPPPPKWFDALAVNTFVSAGYIYNANRPASGINSYRVFDFSDNSFNLDVAELALQIAAAKPRDAGFRVDLDAGNSIPQIAKTQDQPAGSFDLKQAFASYIAPLGSGLRIDVGKFVTHLGYEVIEGFDGYDDSYSRSILFGYAIPFTHTGVKASYAMSSKVSAMLEIVNGWDLFRDNNRSKSVGAQLAVTPIAPLSVLVNWIGGPELANDNRSQRNVYDVVATFKATETLTLGVNGDYGREQGTSLVTPGADAVWKGVAGYATLAATSRFSLATRAETFRDQGGVRLGTGTAAILSEATLTPSYRFTDHVLLRGELRHDWANQPILTRRSTSATSQTSVAANFIFVY